MSAGRDAPSVPVMIRRNAIHLPEAVYRRYLAGIEGAVILWREPSLLIMPVRHLPAGGYLLKQRNAKGDRVIDAAGFFQDHDLDGETERFREIVWRSDLAALEIQL